MWSWRPIQSSHPILLWQYSPMQTISYIKLCFGHFKIVCIFLLWFLWYFDLKLLSNGRLVELSRRQPAQVVFLIFSREKLPWGVRFICALTLSVGFLLYRIVYQMDFTHICLNDVLHNITFPINRSMAHDKNSIVLLIGQLFIDISITSYGIYW